MQKGMCHKQKVGREADGKGADSLHVSFLFLNFNTVQNERIPLGEIRQSLKRT